MSALPFEIRIFHIFIGAFALVVLLAAYYVLGGPVIHVITFEGKEGTPFQGSYVVSRQAQSTPSEALASARNNIEGTYPFTVFTWASKDAYVLAGARVALEQNMYNTITIRRAGVVCSKGYTWGQAVTAACE